MMKQLSLPTLAARNGISLLQILLGVRKKDIEESLRQRKDIRVDPFKQGFKHIENPSSIDLNAVKLCFQVRFSSKTSNHLQIFNKDDHCATRRIIFTYPMIAYTDMEDSVKAEVMEIATNACEKFLNDNQSVNN